MHVYDVRAASCGMGIRIAGNTGPGWGGRFYRSSVEGASIIAGDGAQLPTGVLGSWKVGRSQWCISESGTAPYTVSLSGMVLQRLLIGQSECQTALPKRLTRSRRDPEETITVS